MGDFALDPNYVDVASRIAEFRTKHPEGSLQPADLATPYVVAQIGEQTFIVVVAAAYRTPDDGKPGIGMAYEQFPGRTPYTRGSELQNAETSAWGRAIVAALAADTRKGIASAEDVRNRHAEQDRPAAHETPVMDLQRRIVAAGEQRGYTAADIVADFATRTDGKDPRVGTEAELQAYLDWLVNQPPRTESVTQAQLTKLHVQLGELKVTEQADKHTTLGLLLRRPVTSSKDLTKTEASQVIEQLDRCLRADNPSRALDAVLANLEDSTQDGGLP